MNMWSDDKDSLKKIIEFKDFKEAMSFVSQVAELAEEVMHHPSIKIDYNKVELTLTTHDKGNKITDKDHKLAKLIDDLGAGGLEDKAEEVSVEVEELIMYADGGSRGNPGPAASGYVLYDTNNVQVVRGGRYLGSTTNNQAEYDSLKQGLEHAAKLGAKKVSVFMDSQLVVKQMRGEYKVRHPGIKKVYNDIKANTIPKLEEISFNHVPRELNKEADAEVNRVLDQRA